MWGAIHLSDRPRLISRQQFADLATKGESVDGLAIRKSYPFAIEKDAISDETRTVSVVISTESVDRDGDIVKADGWDLTDYLKNPVALWAHDYKSPPIAKATSIGVSGSKLRVVDEFATKDVYPFADMVYQLVKGGFISATSVGFVPTEFEPRKEGFGFQMNKSLLLEHSWVPVPSNQDALVEARSLGIDLLPLKAWAEEVLDTYHQEAGIWLPRKDIERALKLVSGEPVSLPVEGRFFSLNTAPVSVLGTFKTEAPAQPQADGDAGAGPESPAASEDERNPAVSVVEITEPEPVAASAPALTSPIEERSAAEPEGLTFELEEPTDWTLELAEEEAKGDLFDFTTEQLAGLIGSAVSDAVAARWTALTGRLD